MTATAPLDPLPGDIGPDNAAAERTCPETMRAEPKSVRAQYSLHRLGRLTRRREFLAAAASRRKWVAPGFVLQMRAREEREAERIPAIRVRFGLTATKKLGNAVVRNRARRRLREAARLVLAECAPPGTDFVLVARAETLTRPFAALLADLKSAIGRLSGTRGRSRANDT